MLALHQRAGPESALREPGVGGGEHEARPAGAGVRVHLPAAAIRTAYASAEGRDKPAASIRTTYASGQGRDLTAAIRIVQYIAKVVGSESEYIIPLPPSRLGSPAAKVGI